MALEIANISFGNGDKRKYALLKINEDFCLK